ncbi:MAG: hypothetical protein IJ187_09635 [Neisseriaceae bacterium]|nr:hypothetical protein [Neisseriaceae bacterium]MBR1819214.1 hypothetical protein [Neisseriaceae bacterium]
MSKPTSKIVQMISHKFSDKHSCVLFLCEDGSVWYKEKLTTGALWHKFIEPFDEKKQSYK